MRNLRESLHAVIDINVVIMLAVAFAAMMVMGFVIWKLKEQFDWRTVGTQYGGHKAQTAWNNTTANITGGFDNAINLILVAVTIFILAIAISALLMLRGRQ